MDKKEQETQELLVEDQVRRGWAVIPVPPSTYQELDAAHRENPASPLWPAVRFTKLTHKVRRDIAAAVSRKYNADLRDEGLLSNAQLLELTAKRGEWTPDEQRRLAELQEKTAFLMRTLSAPQGESHMAWTDRLTEIYQRIRTALLDDQPEMVPVLDRWVNYDVNMAVDYTVLFAGLQGGEAYDPNKDFQQLMETVPFELTDDLETLEDLATRMQSFLELGRLRGELNGLLMKQSKIFAESVENRRESTEAMIRLEHIAHWAELDGTPTAKLTAADELPEMVLEWLLVECHFFVQGIPPETREHLQQWGFLPAPSESGSSASSDVSPAEPLSSSDSAASATTLAGSSV